MRLSKNNAAKRLRREMRERGLTPNRLAEKAGMSVRTLQNVFSGCGTRAAKQRLVDALGTDGVFPGIHPMKRRVLLVPGTQFAGLTSEDRAAAEKEFLGLVRPIPGGGIEFIKSVWVNVEVLTKKE
jgi:transcriptional regulator with XRE-family HTH domain